VPILSRIESSAKTDPTLQGVAVVLPAAEVNAAWRRRQHGQQELRQSRAWRRAAAGLGVSHRRFERQPPPRRRAVIGDGRLYVIDTEGQVHAFAPIAAPRIWRTGFANQGDGAASCFGGGESFDSGRAYVTTGLGDVAALEARPASCCGSPPGGPAARLADDRAQSVYVMTQNNEIYALNAADGAQLWNESGSLGQTGVCSASPPRGRAGTIVAGYSSASWSPIATRTAAACGPTPWRGPRYRPWSAF
jgi:outer membrane protein assembly factor BamB